MSFLASLGPILKFAFAILGYFVSKNKADNETAAALSTLGKFLVSNGIKVNMNSYQAEEQKGRLEELWREKEENDQQKETL